MKYRLNPIKAGLPFTVALLWIAATGAAWAGGWNDYKPANLSDSMARYALEFKEAGFQKGAVNINIHPGDPLRVTVRYLGNQRELDARRGTLIVDMWGKSLRMDREMLARTFQKEIEVEENGRTYWLPIQDALLPPLEKEVGRNGAVELWVVFIGAIEKDMVFLVNEFQAQ
ncbi:MAG: hypothetical protein OEZ51_10310 [Nitrospinota bacterium]|nr:hypothetical protein [Nitrospinota bacterium]